jgi:Lrp/AsnC family transcriptional regulator, leucine-responsive regulatory protein
MNTSEIEQKILFALDQDGRVSLAHIARQLKTSTQVIKYHFDKLNEKGLVKHFWAFVDYDKAGYSFFWGYFFRFAGLSTEKEREMYEYLNAHPYIPIVMRADGYAELHICIIARDVFHHTQILNDFYAHFGAYIAMNELVVGVGFVKFPRTYLVGEENKLESKALSGGTTEVVKLSELDRKIIAFLLKDGRLEFATIARRLGVSTGLIHKHYYRLKQRGVITKITYTPNYQALGLKHYRVLVKILQYQQDRVEELYRYCARHPNIVHYIKLMGNWELMLEIELADDAGLRELLRDIKYNFKDIVTDIQKNEIYQVDKFTQMADEYPEFG